MSEFTPTTDRVLDSGLMPCAVAYHHANLTRKLEKALRAILPYAENESEALYALRDSEEAKEEADQAFEAVCEAHRALDYTAK